MEKYYIRLTTKTGYTELIDVYDEMIATNIYMHFLFSKFMDRVEFGVCKLDSIHWEEEKMSKGRLEKWKDLCNRE